MHGNLKRKKRWRKIRKAEAPSENGIQKLVCKIEMGLAASVDGIPGELLCNESVAIAVCIMYDMLSYL